MNLLESTLALIVIPLIAGVGALFISNRWQRAQSALALMATLVSFFITIILFKHNFIYSIPWAGLGINFSIRLDHLSAFILLSTGFFALSLAIYCSVFLKDKNYARQFYSYLLLSLAMVNGAILANNLVLLLFFWEGLLLTLFGLISIGNPDAFKTATKAFIIIGISDLCLMIGIGLTGFIAGTLTMSAINLALDVPAGLAFILLVIGAIAKSGCMPFHSWIPDAALDAPLPFMAFFPAAVEKLLGIYFLTRICLQLFQMQAAGWAGITLMTVGAITIVLAVLMALIQKDYKKLLSYHAISQVGYMILGIGTGVPAGIVGGLFHMVNNALYKSCLFFTGGAVEKQAGSTNLEKLGGLGKAMPITFACFIVAAVSISGVPPFNGFFSKELIYDAALERGTIFYLAAILGSFFTAASFLKLGHAAFLGKNQTAAANGGNAVSEAPWPMLLPMLVIALLCIIFGIFNYLPIKHLIEPALGEKLLEGHSFAGFHANVLLVSMTVVVLLGALLNHWLGVRASGSGLKAVDHIHYAPGLKQIYAGAEKKYFDPYDIGLKLAHWVATAAFWADRAVDWFYDKFSVGAAVAFGQGIRRAHNGSYVTYLAWILVGALLMVTYLCW
ncbi:MAG: proton-conducting transporter membrane subunit [Candidatus Margulisiibacteriota bacterium]